MPKTLYIIEFLGGPWDGMVVDVKSRQLPVRVDRSWFDKNKPVTINDNVPLIRSRHLNRNPSYVRVFSVGGVDCFRFDNWR